MFRDMFKIAAISRWYHHDTRVQRPDRRKDQGKVGAICAIAWVVLWIVAIMY